jgi:hypothetical protein
MTAGAASDREIAQAVKPEGFVLLPAAQTRALTACAEADWAEFAATWEDLGPDLFMADGGRYRRRRHAVFTVRDGSMTRELHQPHYQSRDYNTLNGGVQRWFDPVTDAAAGSCVLAALVRHIHSWIAELEVRDSLAWRLEMHQFRIEAHDSEQGQPTPEGMHRDGVDWVAVMLVNRRNVTSGETSIATLDGRRLGSFTLTESGDCVFLDDRRVAHGVTPISPVDPGQAAHRDALVLTFTLDPSG